LSRSPLAGELGYLTQLNMCINYPMEAGLQAIPSEISLLLPSDERQSLARSIVFSMLQALMFYFTIQSQPWPPLESGIKASLRTAQAVAQHPLWTISPMCGDGLKAPLLMSSTPGLHKRGIRDERFS